MQNRLALYSEDELERSSHEPREDEKDEARRKRTGIKRVQDNLLGYRSNKNFNPPPSAELPPAEATTLIFRRPSAAFRRELLRSSKARPFMERPTWHIETPEM
eukprot:5836785-Pyramimonas_sp.AAC.1